MTRHTRGIAAAIAGFVSLSLVGVALANEAEDPVLEETTEVVCPDPGTDEGTTDEGATDEGSTDVGTTDEGATDEGTTDEGVADGTTDGDDDTAAAEPCEGSTDGSDGTDGTEELEELESTEDEIDDLEEDAEVEGGERPQNHGWYVSEATKTCPESGRERGQCISEVAKSDLGKPHADDASAEPEDEDEAEASLEGTDAGAGQPAKASKAPKASKGGGGGKGRGGKG